MLAFTAILYPIFAILAALAQQPQHALFSSSTSRTLSCLTHASIPFYTPNSSSPPNTLPNLTYSLLAKPYNLALPTYPTIITIPETNEQVAKAVLCAREGGLKVTARSGGHSYANFGGGEDGGVVVDLRGFVGVGVDGKLFCCFFCFKMERFGDFWCCWYFLAFFTQSQFHFANPS